MNGAENLVSGGLYVDSRILTNFILTGGGIVSLGGHSSVSGGEWGKLENVKSFRTQLQRQKTKLNRQIQEGQKQHKEINKEWYTPTDKPGNENFTLNGEFGLRIDKDYKSEQYVLFESNWGQHARLVGDVPDTWTEKEVKNKVAPEEKTYPFPGKKKLIDEKIYYQQDFKFVDTETGASKPRPGEHEDSPEYEKPKEKKIDGNYPIIGD